MIPTNPNTTLPAIYLSLLVGQIAIGTILYWLSAQSNPPGPQPDVTASGLSIYQVIGPILLLFAILTAAYLRGRLVQKVEKTDPQAVARAAILSWALVEGANLATVIMAYLQDDARLFVVFVAGMLAFVWLRPATWPLDAS